MATAVVAPTRKRRNARTKGVQLCGNNAMLACSTVATAQAVAPMHSTRAPANFPSASSPAGMWPTRYPARKALWMYASWITERFRSAAIMGAAAEKLTRSMEHENITEAAIVMTCAQHLLLVFIDILWKPPENCSRHLHIIAMRKDTYLCLRILFAACTDRRCIGMSSSTSRQACSAVCPSRQQRTHSTAPRIAIHRVHERKMAFTADSVLVRTLRSRATVCKVNRRELSHGHNEARSILVQCPRYQRQNHMMFCPSCTLVPFFLSRNTLNGFGWRSAVRDAMHSTCIQVMHR